MHCMILYTAHKLKLNYNFLDLLMFCISVTLHSLQLSKVKVGRKKQIKYQSTNSLFLSDPMLDLLIMSMLKIGTHAWSRP